MEESSAIMNIGRGLLGVVAILAVAFLLSAAKSKVNWRLVGGGLLLQLALAVLVLLTPGVRDVIDWISGQFVMVIDFTKAGTGMVFGPLSDQALTTETFAGRGFIFAIHALPTIIFFSALTSVLYYLRVLQYVVFGFAWVMKRLMRLSGAESLAAAANVFVGQTEAPLVVAPYIAKMTRSELMALMVGGMATIAGSVMVIYIGLIAGTDEASRKSIATLFLCASVMNAPAALLIAKILQPETEEVDTNLMLPRDRFGTNLLDALATGTGQGLKLALNVAAMLIAFLAFMALINHILAEWIGSHFLNDWIESWSGGIFDKLTMQSICGFLFAPFAWIIGVNPGDLLQVGKLLGQKIILNEFVAYDDLSQMKAAGSLSPKAIYLSCFALCGFANFSSIGIQLGGIGGMAPERRSTLAELGIKAMIGGAFATMLTASLAGMFYTWAGDLVLAQ